MITKLEHNFTKNTKIYFEHNVEINENSYLIIFGHHINGGFIQYQTGIFVVKHLLTVTVVIIIE